MSTPDKTSKPGPTPEQQAAIDARGNILVMAGAGTGKTTTLINRVIKRLQDPDHPLSLERLLMVTFTEAAAAEMRHRLRQALETRTLEEPENPRWIEQLALLETAHISTLHSFCLKLIRDHFHQLGLDPEFSILAEDQAALARQETLDTLLEERLLGETDIDRATQEWVMTIGQGRTTRMAQLALGLYHSSQALPDPEGWFDQQTTALSSPEPTLWRQWLITGFAQWRNLWLEELRHLAPHNPKAAECAAALDNLHLDPNLETVTKTLQAIVALDNSWDRKLCPKTKMRPPLKRFLDGATFLHTQVPENEEDDPLAQDWEWTRQSLLTLLALAREFSRRYALAKRELGGLDFSDLEQFALELLWDRSSQSPTALAHNWQEQLDEILVDEYQDINAAQDTIIRAVGRTGEHANRFLVGDVKQSIYRFRLADPRIFQEYADRWQGPDTDGQSLSLTSNFRSHPSILDFVNQLFSPLMHRDLGGLRYTRQQYLQPGAPEGWSKDHPTVELHLQVSNRRNTSPEDESRPDREVRHIARQIRTWIQDGLQIRDGTDGRTKPASYRDIAILLRSPKTRAEIYARIFAQEDVPLEIGRSGFYDAIEVADLLNLLRILDNPHQDLPLLGVLRSPLAGFTLDELAQLRIHHRHGPLWAALRRFSRNGPPESSGVAQSRSFLDAYDAWRTLSRTASLSECLETVLEDTGYEAWLATTPNPSQALANLRRFLSLSRQFDQFQRQGLTRFLRYVDAQQSASKEPDAPAAAPTNAVRLLSVHQSKGLEFPIVVLADLGKSINFGDLKEHIILDEDYGACPVVQPPNGTPPYPSLPHWLAAERQRREALGEELRLLYVACTRAKERLLLSGTATPKDVDENWPDSDPQPSVAQLINTNSWLGWVGPWWTHRIGNLSSGTLQSADGLWSSLVLRQDDDTTAVAAMDTDAVAATSDATPNDATPESPLTEAALASVRERIHTPYAYGPSTLEAAKASVSSLRKKARKEAEDESRILFLPRATEQSDTDGEINAAQRGTLHHRVMEAIPLNEPLTQGALLLLVENLVEQGTFTPREKAVLDLESIYSFWRSELGTAIQQNHAYAHRELPFTSRFTPNELAQLGIPTTPNLAPDEFIVVQGVVDLAIILPDTIWIIDFKTDHVDADAAAERAREYTPQLQLYASALSRIYRRPVSQLWLHFLYPRLTLPVPLETPSAPAGQ